jgi:hypothetical protein
MPTDLRRRDDIAAAVAAYDSANPKTRLPRNAARLLTIMFSDRDECSRSLEDLVEEGFGRNNLHRLLRSLVEAGLLAKQRGSAWACGSLFSSQALRTPEWCETFHR